MKRIVRMIWERVRVWIPFFAGCAVVSSAVDRMSVVPTGDAPHLLAIVDQLMGLLTRGEFLDWFEAWSSLVTPHPPAGYGVPLLASLMGMEGSVPAFTAFVGLGFAWHGMLLLGRGGGRRSWGPWIGALLLFSMPATWTFVAHMTWDVLAAGCVAACLGHLHASDGLRNKGHALGFGAFMGLSFVTKYSAPAFLVLPTVFAGLAIVRFRAWTGLLVSLFGFGLVAGPWLVTHGDAMIAYVLSSSGVTQTISASPASSWAVRFEPNNLLYYPTVLRDMIGWPGLGLVVVALVLAWRRPAGRWSAWGVFSGGVLLTFAGENQSRYLFPAIPLLGVILDVGMRPGLGSPMSRFGMLCGVAGLAPALWGAWMGTTKETTVPPTRDQTHAAESLLEWGTWPWPATAFRPVSNPTVAWKVDDALAALVDEAGVDAHQVGMLLPNDARMPPGSTYAWRAGQRGLSWAVATIVPTGPSGRPMVFVGPLKPVGSRISRRFEVAYAVHPRGSVPDVLTEMGAIVRWQQDLPFSMQGSVVRVPEQAWNTPVGQMLQKDPIDG